MTLLPPSLSEWLTDDCHVFFPLDLVHVLNLSQILSPAEPTDSRWVKGLDLGEDDAASALAYSLCLSPLA